MIVEITDRDAIYVNNHRITNRLTKWGVHQVIQYFTIKRKKDLKNELIDRGFENLINLIDDKRFL